MMIKDNSCGLWCWVPLLGLGEARPLQEVTVTWLKSLKTMEEGNFTVSVVLLFHDKPKLRLFNDWSLTQNSLTILWKKLVCMWTWPTVKQCKNLGFSSWETTGKVRADGGCGSKSLTRGCRWTQALCPSMPRARLLLHSETMSWFSKCHSISVIIFHVVTKLENTSLPFAILLVHGGCYSRIPPTGWLINSRLWFLIPLQAEVEDQSISKFGSDWGPLSHVESFLCVPTC